MTGVDLLAYADRLGGDLPRLRALLDGPLRDFAGVHILPFFVPFDGADAGFDPIDHAAVDPRLGTWDDVRAIAAGREVTADLIVNHVSSESAEFVDWLALGEESAHDGMFLTFDTVFPDRATEDDITAFYRPRPGLPFTAYRMADGRRRLVWTTFMPSQIDLDVANDRARAYLRRILATLRSGGVTTVRLDAVGYAVKTPGSDSFMTPETLEFVREIVAMARAEDLRVLVEVHAHYSQQLAIAPLVDHVYDFALAPLLLHSLGTGTSDRLAEWLRIRPQNAITVLDTHDGIGIIDAGPSGDRPGLIDQDEMAAIFARAAEATHGHSTLGRPSSRRGWTCRTRSTRPSSPPSAPTPGATCSPGPSSCGCPADPQLYYVGLLGGLDDVALFERTGQGRDVNRHAYTPAELDAAFASDGDPGATRSRAIAVDAPRLRGRVRLPCGGGRLARTGVGARRRPCRAHRVVRSRTRLPHPRVGLRRLRRLRHSRLRRSPRRTLTIRTSPSPTPRIMQTTQDITVTRSATEVVLVAPAYTLGVALTRPRATIAGLDGEIWSDLSLLASVDRLGVPDESSGPTAVTVEEAQDGTVRVTVLSDSSAWATKAVVLHCTPNEVRARVEVTTEEDDARITDLTMFGGQAALPTGAAGTFRSGIRFPTVFVPTPTEPIQVVRPSNTQAQLGVVGDAEPGRLNGIFSPPPLVFALGRPSIAPDAPHGPTDMPVGDWLGVSVVAPIAQLGFTTFRYDAIDGGFLFRLTYEGHTRVRGGWMGVARVRAPAGRGAPHRDPRLPRRPRRPRLGGTRAGGRGLVARADLLRLGSAVRPRRADEPRRRGARHRQRRRLRAPRRRRVRARPRPPVPLRPLAAAPRRARHPPGHRRHRRPLAGGLRHQHRRHREVARPARLDRRAARGRAARPALVQGVGSGRSAAGADRP